MKNRTCSRHFQRKEVNTKLERHGVGLLEQGTNCTQVFVYQLSEIESAYDGNIGWGENLAFENLQ